MFWGVGSLFPGYRPSVFKGRVCRLCGKHVRWFSLHSKFIFLEVCRVTGRFSRENVNKTNRSGVYSTLLFEGCRVNGFRVATVGGFDCIHLRSGARGGRACSGRPAGVAVNDVATDVSTVLDKTAGWKYQQVLTQNTTGPTFLMP